VIRLTWLQFRAQALTAAAALAAFAVLLAATGPHLASLYAASRITGCRGGTCATAASGFLSKLAATSPYPIVYVLGIGLILAAPAIIGIFWGAPLIARELEARTFALAWTQSITRTRWLAVKLTLTGLAAMAVTEGLSLMYGWWAAPIGEAARLGYSGQPVGMGPFSLPAFDAHGITPLGYAAFAFTLGVTAGVLLRRAVPAMAITLAIFAAVQVAFPLWIRPHLSPARHTSAALGSYNGSTHVSGSDFAFTVDHLPSQPGAWILSSGAVNAAGQPVSTIPAACAKLPAGGPGLTPCLTGQGWRVAITYQPASRYWAFQATETAIYLALALALAGYCFWRLNRRTT